MIRQWLISFAATLLLIGCSSNEPSATDGTVNGKIVPMAHAKTFTVTERDGFKIVDIEASVVTWGGTAGGPPQRARLVLVPRAVAVPELTGDLAGATLIRTPVQLIAVNDQPHEAIIRALGVADRLVAVGGHSSYDDGIRARVKRGQIQQVGYGWHQPPTLDALVASKPDVFLARMADLTHTQHLQRVQALGIPVVPTFIDAEPHYMGRVDWVRLVGMLTGKEREADTFVAKVTEEVERLKAQAKAQPRRSLLWAWYLSGGDRWSVTQRNADAALIRDANLELAMGGADDPRLDSFSRLSTEQLLQGGTNADCWMIRDPLSSPFGKKDVLARFKAYREGCVFWQPGAKNLGADSWEVWEMGVIRPDWMLADIIKLGHPALRDGRWRYFAPENWEGANGGSGAH
jgi:iron complex transport system substrate-binding protein